MKRMKKTIEQVEETVDRFLELKEHSPWGLNPVPNLEEERQHVRNMCVSMLQTKWGVGYPGGSFVQAVVGNDLMGAFARADSINQRHIGLYVELLYNN
jgi:hypothetical protein